MARQLERFDNLVSLFLTRAAEKGDPAARALLNRSGRVLGDSLATLVNAFGNGAYLTTSVLFLTTVAGLSPAAIATGKGTEPGWATP